MNFLDVFLGLAERIFWSMWISIGFALLFNTPRRALWITGVLGGIGWGIKFILLGTVGGLFRSSRTYTSYCVYDTCRYQYDSW